MDGTPAAPGHPLAGTGPLYPVNLVLSGRPVLVVGGGRVAANKVAELVLCGAEVTVVAPSIDPVLRDDERVRCEERPYRQGEAARYRFVVTATGHPGVDRTVYEDGEAAGVWVNSADDPDRCSATLPARLRRGSLLVTVSTEGRSPALAAWLRSELAATVGPEYEVLLEVVAEERERLRAQGRPTEVLDWQTALGSGMLDEIRAGRIAAAKELLRACLSSSSA